MGRWSKTGRRGNGRGKPWAPAPSLPTGRRPASVGRELLDRAEAAARRAGELTVDWFWLHKGLLLDRAQRLSTAAERSALAAHRAGLLWPRLWVSVGAQRRRRAGQGAPR